MARYYFDIRDGAFNADKEGQELPSLSSARHAALETLHGLMQGRSKGFWGGQPWHVQCHDERGLILFTLTLTGLDAAAVRLGGSSH